MSLTDEKQLNNRFDTANNLLNSYNTHLKKNRDYYDDRMKNNYWSNEWFGDNGPWFTHYGLQKSFNHKFNDYVLAPLASGIEAIGDIYFYDPVARDRPSAITVNDGIKMSQRKSKTQGKTKPQKLFGGKAPVGLERFDRKHNRKEVLGSDRKWHPKYRRLGGQMHRFNPFTGAYNDVAPKRRFTGPRPRGIQKKSAPSYGDRKRMSSRGPPRNIDRSMNYGQNIGAQSQSGQTFKNLGGGNDGARWGVRMYCGQISYGNVATGGNGVVHWIPSSTDIGGQYYFIPYSPVYIPVSTPLSQALPYYEDYRFEGGEVEFVPCISGYSNPDIRLSVLVTTAIDACESMASNQFVGTPGTPNGTSTPTRTVVMSNPHSCSKPGWAEKGLRCPLPKRPWLKIRGPSSGATGGVYDFTQTVANYRENVAFLIMVNISGTIPATTDLLVCDVYMNLKVAVRKQVAPLSKLVTYKAPSIESTDVDILREMLKEFKEAKKKENEKKEIERADSRISLRSESLDDHKAINTRKSKSAGSNPDPNYFKRFDSTKGYPGEGPFICKTCNKLIAHCVCDRVKEDDEFIIDYCNLCMKDEVDCKCVEFGRHPKYIKLPGGACEVCSEHIVNCKCESRLNNCRVCRPRGYVTCVCATKEFDSTLGFPGEGPPKVDTNSFCELILDSATLDVRYLAARRRIKDRYIALLRAGGDYEVNPLINEVLLKSPQHVNKDRAENITLALKLALATFTTPTSEVSSAVLADSAHNATVYVKPTSKIIEELRANIDLPDLVPTQKSSKQVLQSAVVAKPG